MVYMKSSSKGFVPLMLIILIIVSIFLLAISIPILKYVVHEVRLENDADDSVQQVSKDYLAGFDDGFSGLWDGLFVFIFVMSLVILVACTTILDAHPLIVLALIILIIPLVIVGMSLSNAHNELINDDFSSTASGFPMTSKLMQYLPHIVLLMILVVVIGMYAKRRYL